MSSLERRGAVVLAAALAIVAGGAPASAQRVDTRTLTCREAQDLVKSRQAVTLATSRNVYDRYVANSRACGVQGRAANAFVPTRDEPECRLQTCRSRRGSDGAR